MSTRQPIRTVSFIGLGLIGMSLLRALKASVPAGKNSPVMSGYDPSFSESDREAVLCLGLDRFTDNRNELFSADLVVLAAPVETNIALLDELKELAPKSTLVADVSSTKTMICRRAKELSIPFIGMHPMAGKEQQGYRESSEELIRGSRVILCGEPDDLNSFRGTLLREMLEAAGCRISLMDAEEHDRVTACISHLPQLVSTALMTRCAGALESSGPGFLSMARLAASPWSIWRDIISTNSGNIADELERFSLELKELADEVRRNDRKKLEGRFNEANRQHTLLKEMNRK
ncbi:prephenate dehydrogenase [Chlorobium phaeovibrioides]|uniref:Prephenate dehydrogenase/arogenate dehydrogenase family protein n=2 Tax=Chlorobium phaeovibrioides TaxID=1094 RepID=A0ABW9UQA3_CHLPH|nr:prephenate dehydrogenase/arogenate dehydrogenase family protein [Chlorobium phaeovibrioides]MWV54219.1 prephenate dehydrogenase/arogenate dehydrogenase family protein [Chlorobium phaeovibrioides]HCD35801.1 prephenate dehydrogenase/arogenate dehydrogenase family protein [Chlorobium sp.]